MTVRFYTDLHGTNATTFYAPTMRDNPTSYYIFSSYPFFTGRKACGNEVMKQRSLYEPDIYLKQFSRKEVARILKLVDDYYKIKTQWPQTNYH